MIIPMAKVRLLGARARLPDVLASLQDLGVLHLDDTATTESLQPLALTARQRRLHRQLVRMLDDIDTALATFGSISRRSVTAGSADPLPPLARLARRARLAAERIASRSAGLAEEKALILKYRDFFAAFASALAGVAHYPHLTTYAVVVPARERGVIQRLGDALRAEIGPEFAFSTHDLASGDVALLLVLPKSFAEKMERALADARLPEIPMPAAYGGSTLASAVPRMLTRLKEIPREAEQLVRERSALA